ncbi:hypothetical protein JB92DRAFT_2903511 [Gautieria morchelliformis]|nr:hypothetical protein JB92DRAFT_2903511 [Gautieria morchelliformis]
MFGTPDLLMLIVFEFFARGSPRWRPEIDLRNAVLGDTRHATGKRPHRRKRGAAIGWGQGRYCTVLQGRAPLSCPPAHRVRVGPKSVPPFASILEPPCLPSLPRR